MNRIFLNLILFLSFEYINASLLMKSAAPNKERRLAVMSGYNEKKDSSDYLSSVKQMLNKVRNLRSELVEFRDATFMDIDNLIERLNSETQNSVYDLIIQDMLKKKIQENKNK